MPGAPGSSASAASMGRRGVQIQPAPRRGGPRARSRSPAPGEAQLHIAARRVEVRLDPAGRLGERTGARLRHTPSVPTASMPGMARWAMQG